MSDHETYLSYKKSSLYNEKNECNKCGEKVHICDNCMNHICISSKVCHDIYMIMSTSKIYPSKAHSMCDGCKQVVTCSLFEKCKNCEYNSSYNMIIDNVAIGSYLSPYDSFDIIVNMDYPQNNANRGEILADIKDNKFIIRCGFMDWYDSMTIKHLNIVYCMVKERETYIRNQGKDNIMILFHCTMGISRSSTMAIYYLAKKLGIGYDEAYMMAKQKRRIIKPNDGFKKLLGL
jgi:hypothetical protein